LALHRGSVVEVVGHQLTCGAAPTAVRVAFRPTLAVSGRRMLVTDWLAAPLAGFGRMPRTISSIRSIEVVPPAQVALAVNLEDVPVVDVGKPLDENRHGFPMDGAAISLSWPASAAGAQPTVRRALPRRPSGAASTLLCLETRRQPDRDEENIDRRQIGDSVVV
jgi:hypothetical protein